MDVELYSTVELAPKVIVGELVLFNVVELEPESPFTFAVIKYPLILIKDDAEEAVIK